MFFLETKLYVWTILTSSVSANAFFHFRTVQHDVAMMFTGCNNILDILVSCHTELSVDSVILTVCDKSCSIADQNLTVFKSYKDGKD